MGGGIVLCCHAVNKAMGIRTALYAPPMPNFVGADVGAGSHAKSIFLAERSVIAPVIPVCRSGP